MSCFFGSTLVAAFMIFCLQLIGLGDDIKPAAINPELAAADQLFRAGRFADAETSYQELLKTESKLVPHELGLLGRYLRQEKIDEALDAVNNPLTTQPDSAALLAARGDVQFRREASHLAPSLTEPFSSRLTLASAIHSALVHP